MADDINYDVDFDEYETLEAEAETLARGDKKPATTQPNQQEMVPGRVGTSGRAPRASPVTVVPARRLENRQRREELRSAPVSQPEADNELEALEAEEARLAGEEEAAEAEPRAQKWLAFHQPEKIGIINTETREVIEGYKDIGSATGMAKVLNEIDSIIVGGGYQ